MKKILMTLAVALVAASTYAGQINWTIDLSDLPGGPWNTTTNPHPWTGYIAYLVTPDQLAALTTDGLLDEDKWGAATLSSMTIGKRGTASGLYGSYGAGTEISLYVILFNTTGPVVAGTTGYMISGPVTREFGASGDPEWAFEYGTFGSEGLTLPAFQTEWSVIPEPATMALLGIGVVAVGLRRRRK